MPTLFRSFTRLANADESRPPVLCPCRSSSLSHYEVKPNSSLESYNGSGPPFHCVFKVRLEGSQEESEGQEPRVPHLGGEESEIIANARPGWLSG